MRWLGKVTCPGQGSRKMTRKMKNCSSKMKLRGNLLLKIIPVGERKSPLKIVIV
jgi:hypothetical protein